MKNLLFLYLSIGSMYAWAQDAPRKHWVFLRETSVNYAEPMLGADALTRRAAQGIALRNSDFALQSEAVAAVAHVAPTVGRSRWLRALVVEADAAQLAQLRALPWVQSTQPVGIMRRSLTEAPGVPPTRVAPDLGSEAPRSALGSEEDGVHGYQYGASTQQVNQIQVNALHDAGFDGAGVKVALMDAGFTGADTYTAFQGAWQQGRVLGTWDYIDGDTNVFHLGSHGMSVWSTICADLDATFVGTAPKASFYLFKTENQLTETIAEEYNWVMAAERADSLGVDVINTSLGYTTFDNGVGDHSYADMDGRTTPISLAAVAAARTGMILCISAGNEGAASWKYISAPADADSILAVGAVDEFGVRASFSSQGPSADGRVKPDVAARGLGATVVNSSGNVATSSGTSFSSPIMAGAMASLVQAAKTLPNGYTANDLIHRVRMSAHRSFAPDSFLGYGIPNFATVLSGLGIEQPDAQRGWTLHSLNQGGWVLRRSDARSADALEIIAVDGRLLDRLDVPSGQNEVRIDARSFWCTVRSRNQVVTVPAN
ncbi:MAG: S8 family serine peptidase [Bacteroidota bacterium]